MYKFLLVILLSLYVRLVNAQSIYPVLMEQFDNGLCFLNPAKPLNNNYFECMVADKRYYGLFENIGVNYFSGRLNVSSQSSKSNIVSLNFVHEYDGDYLNRNRMNFGYLFQTNINNNAQIGLGITGGLFNYFVKSTSSNVGASVWLSDANTGVWFKNKFVNLGFAMNQFTNATDKLYLRTIQLRPFYVLNFDYQYNFKPQLAFKPGFIFRKYNLENQMDVFLMANNNKHLSGGVNWKINRGFTFIFGLENMEIFNQQFNITTSYSVQNISESSFNSNQLELCLKYFIKK